MFGSLLLRAAPASCISFPRARAASARLFFSACPLPTVLAVCAVGWSPSLSPLSSSPACALWEAGGGWREGEEGEERKERGRKGQGRENGEGGQAREERRDRGRRGEREKREGRGGEGRAGRRDTECFASVYSTRYRTQHSSPRVFSNLPAPARAQPEAPPCAPSGSPSRRCVHAVAHSRPAAPASWRFCVAVTAPHSGGS